MALISTYTCSRVAKIEAYQLNINIFQEVGLTVISEYANELASGFADGLDDYMSGIH